MPARGRLGGAAILLAALVLCSAVPVVKKPPKVRADIMLTTETRPNAFTPVIHLIKCYLAPL